MSELQVNGLLDLQRALQDLPLKIERNVMRGAVNAGGQVFRREARANVPIKSGDLRNSIRVSVRVQSKAGTVEGTVKAGNKRAFYAHMVEYGTQAHIIKAKRGGMLRIGGKLIAQVQHPGARAKPFMRPAFDAGAQKSVDAFAEYIRNRLPREVAKLKA